ncbi:hypothetical protein [Vibrio alginolyticus]
MTLMKKWTMVISLLSVLTACAQPPLVLETDVVESTNCSITLEDNRMNKNMLDQRGDLPTVVGYIEWPLPLSPSVHDFTLSKLCSIEQISSKQITFEIDKFQCDWKGRYTYGVGVFELELTYLNDEQKRKRISVRERMDYDEDLSGYEICRGAISKTFSSLPARIIEQI